MVKEIKIEIPENIADLKKQVKDKTDYINRLSIINTLGSYKCQQSKDILWNLMINDKVYAVQELAFRKLQAFGEKVKLPKKKKGHLIKDINKKLKKVRDTFSGEFTNEQFNEKFKSIYPEEFDIYTFEKNTKFDEWISNVLISLPKNK